jgi:hypothetical protein
MESFMLTKVPGGGGGGAAYYGGWEGFQARENLQILNICINVKSRIQIKSEK